MVPREFVAPVGSIFVTTLASFRFQGASQAVNLLFQGLTHETGFGVVA